MSLMINEAAVFPEKKTEAARVRRTAATYVFRNKTETQPLESPARPKTPPQPSYSP